MTVGQPQQVAGKRNAAVQAKIPVSVRPGFHVNSNTPTEEYLIPLKLTWTAAGALESGSVTYPKPSMEKYEFAEKPLSVFTGDFELVANFKVAANAPGRPRRGGGEAALPGVQRPRLLPAQDGRGHNSVSDPMKRSAFSGQLSATPARLIAES